MAVNSVVRALRLLNVLAHAGDAVPLGEVARRTGLARSTTHNLLATLVAEEYAIGHDGAYRLGPRAAALGAVGERSVHEALSTAAESVAQLVGHSTIAVSLADGRPLEVVHATGSGAITVREADVSARPALDLATGRCLVCYEDPGSWPDFVDELYHDTGHPPQPDSLQRWTAALTAFRTHSVAARIPEPHSDSRTATSAVAVPIWRTSHPKPSWSLGCSVPWSVTADEVVDLTNALRDATDRLAERLGVPTPPLPRPSRHDIEQVIDPLAHLVNIGE